MSITKLSAEIKYRRGTKHFFASFADQKSLFVLRYSEIFCAGFAGATNLQCNCRLVDVP